jgi:hypothetical protein
MLDLEAGMIQPAFFRKKVIRPSFIEKLEYFNGIPVLLACSRRRARLQQR